MNIRKLKIGILDWYIIRKFIGTYAFAILLIVVILVVFDAVEKMDDFMELDAPLSKIAFSYYLNFVPYFINQFSGLITFISVIFFTSKMAYNTEIIAILSGGVSFGRVMWPYFISALFITLISLILNLFVIPGANQRRIDFESEYLKKGLKNNYEEHTYRQITPDTYIYIQGYNNIGKNADFMVLETYDSGQIVSSLAARNPSFDTKTRRWKAPKYIETVYDGDSAYLYKKQRLDTLINLSDNEIGKVENYIQTLNISRLRKFIDEQERKGSDMIAVFKVEEHNRYAYPMSTFILTLIGVSLSSRKVRGGTGLHIGIGITLCFSFILFMRFANEFAKNGVLNPGLAVWTPNLLFAVIAVYLYKKAPK